MRVYEFCEETVLPRSIDWSDFANQYGGSVSTSTWDGDGLTVTDESISSNVTTATFSGAQKGVSYIVKNTVTLTGGYVDCRKFKVIGVDAKEAV